MGEQLYKITNSKIKLQNLKIIMLFKNTDHNIEKIYQNIVEISRSKFFYIDFELDDSFETRFDLIIFHAFMIFYFYIFAEIQQVQKLFKFIENCFFFL